MKKLKLLVVLSAIFVFSANSCKKDEPITLSVNPQQLTFNAVDTQRQPIVVSTNATEWSYQATESWVKTEKANDILYVSVENHTNLESGRNAIITFSAGDAPTASVIVNQNAKVRDNLSINTTSLTFEANETGTKTVVIATNASDWTPTAGASWITAAKSGDNLNVSVSTNSSTSARNSNVTIKAGDANDVTITVTQNGRNTLSVSPSSLTFAYNTTASQNLTVTTNASSWSVSRPSSVNWIQYTFNGNILSVSPTGTNTSTSARTVDLTFEAGSATAVVVRVTQNGSTPTQSPQVRFRKTSNNAYTVMMGISNYDVTDFLAYYLFNNSTGTSSYQTITSGYHIPFAFEGEEPVILIWPSTGTYTYNFQNNRRYTFEYNGSTYRMIDEGTYSLPVEGAAPALAPEKPTIENAGKQQMPEVTNRLKDLNKK